MFFGTQKIEEADMDLRERLSLRLQARNLDRALAAGASPDGSELLARRAQALVRADTRNEVAASLHRFAWGNGRSALGARVAAVPARGAEIRGELDRVAMRLLDPGPVAPRGVAMALELLSDGAGPLFWADSDQDLGARLRTVLEALEPRVTDPKPETEGSPR
jgi:hypothetical protein